MFFRNKNLNRRYRLISLMICISFLINWSIAVYAADIKILSTLVYEDDIYIYIRGASELQSDSSVQIGNVLCQNEQISSASLGNSGINMRTLILVDNSKSISEKSHTDIQEILEGIVSTAMEGEKIKIGYFSDKVTYLCDYTDNKEILSNVINTITYSNQDTYLSDVLHDVISDLKAENTCEYTRIIVIADGADDNPNGLTGDEVRSYIGKSAYPIYAVGIMGKNNSSELETMFSYSRASGSEYFLLDGSITNEDIVNSLAQDQNSICLKISPDETLKDGSNKSILLKLSMPESSIELTTSVDMPFGSGILLQPDEDLENSEDKEDDKKENSLPVLRPIDKTENKVIEEDEKISLIPIIIVVVVLLILITVVILIIFKKRKKNESLQSLTQEEDASSGDKTPNVDSSGDDTVIVGATAIDNTPSLWKGNNTYLVLKCIDDTNVMFKEPITDVIRIGRRRDQDIVIDDAKLSKSHCEIQIRGDLLYIKDCNSTNGTKYEGVAVYDSEKPIVSGGKIEIGAHRYRVELIKE